MTTLIPTGLDYTARDKAAYLSRMTRAALSVFPDWTDQEAASFALLFLESGATIGDFISYYQERAAREAHLMTCTERVNAVRHARKLNHSPRRRTATLVTLNFTLTAAALGDVTFEEGWIVRSKSTDNAVAVQLLSNLIIVGGSTIGSVSAENSTTYQETYEPTTAPSQRLGLSFSPFIAIDSFADSLGEWQEVVNFRDSGASARHYQLLLNNDSEAEVVFGDGVNGKIPVGTTTIVYRYGGGEVAISANQMTVPEFTAVDNLGNTVLFSVTNLLDGTTGLAEETVGEIQENAPAGLRARSTTTALEDYAINAKEVPGVARAMLLTADQFTGLAENYGQLSIVARGSRYWEPDGPYAPATPTAATLTAVELYLTSTKPKTVTFRLDVQAYLAKQVDITARIKLSAGAVAATVDTAIRRALQTFFAALNTDGTENTQIDFGYNYRDVDGAVDPYLAWSDLFNSVRDALGVRAVDRDTFVPIDDVLLVANEFPTLGTVTLINDATGLALV